ncbi:MAG: hypothetical protein ABSG25_08775 [Bryobacteraceae bacterium]
MIQTICFSKDRPSQLNTLFESLEFFTDLNDISVLYKYSNIDFKKGYDKLIKKYSHIRFIEETNFKQDILNMINHKKYLQFLTDDDIFINEFKGFNGFDDNILSLSLRLGKNCIYCYTENKPMIVPEINNGIFEYNKIKNNGDWSYAYSLDGDIFDTKTMLYLINKSFFFSPNTYEGYIQRFQIDSKPYKMILDNQKLFNNPCNRVQQDCNNRFGKISADYLNQKFLEGFNIDLDYILKQKDKIDSPHYEVDIKLI